MSAQAGALLYEAAICSVLAVTRFRSTGVEDVTISDERLFATGASAQRGVKRRKIAGHLVAADWEQRVSQSTS